MKTTEFEFGGITYHLAFNSAAMFDCFDRFGSEDIMGAVTSMTVQGFKNLCWLLQEMSEQGELLRHYFGYDVGKTIDAQELELLLTPETVTLAHGKVLEALTDGFSRTERDKESTDPWLAELEQKKTKESPGRNGFMWQVKCIISRLRRLFCCRRG